MALLRRFRAARTGFAARDIEIHTHSAKDHGTRLTVDVNVAARLDDVPEPGAIIIVYGGLIAAVIVSTVAFIVSLVSFLS